MDKVLGIQQKKNCKPKVQQHKSKKKQEEVLKIVYISSPVNFNTSASEFRSLVQQLTGRDSPDHLQRQRRRESEEVEEVKEEENGVAETTISEVGVTSSSSVINSDNSHVLDDHHVYDDVSISHIFDTFFPSNIW